MHPQKKRNATKACSRVLDHKRKASMGNLFQNNKRKSDREEIREEADRPMPA
jgi:hypothetical protein